MLSHYQIRQQTKRQNRAYKACATSRVRPELHEAVGTTILRCSGGAFVETYVWVSDEEAAAHMKKEESRESVG